MIKLIILFIFSISVIANNKVIYGKDNRTDYFNLSAQQKLLADATAVLINNIRLRKKKDHYQLSKKTLKDYGVCSDGRFINQPIAGSCTGFLIAPDLLATAGHCIQTIGDCKTHRWLFNYKAVQKEFNFKISNEDVYHCVEVVKRGFSHKDGIDYTVVRLERPKLDASPLKMRTQGKLNKDAKLFTIGYPTGLPVKLASYGIIRKINNHNFITNLDTFAGNSGSPVLNKDTLEVEGILIRGEDDYVTDTRANCKRVNRCSEHTCEGETVTSIINLTKE